MESELERRTARLVAARKALAEVAGGAVAPELRREIDEAHARVEAAERRMVHAWFPVLAGRARRRLAAARALEEELLATHGFGSWLGLQMAQVDSLVRPPAPDAVAAAELEHRLALAAWEELAGRGAPLPDDATPTALEPFAGLLRPDGPRAAVA